LLTGYGPVCLVWFDTPRMMTPERSQRFVEIVEKLQPATLIDGRLGVKGDYFTTGDNFIPDLARDDDWETPATVNHTWGFRRDDEDWKSPGEILFKLMDIVSKGGNYLLNVGPDADGVIPKPSADNLRTVGRWLKVYGEAVYGAGRSPSERNSASSVLPRRTATASRCSSCGTTGAALQNREGLYHHIQCPPRRSRPSSFKNQIRKAYVLGDPQKQEVTIEMVNGVRVARVPRPGPHATAYVLVLEIEGDKIER